MPAHSIPLHPAPPRPTPARQPDYGRRGGAVHWGLSDFVVLGAALGGGFGLLESVLRFGVSCSPRNGPTVTAWPLVPCVLKLPALLLLGVGSFTTLLPGFRTAR
ncbi:hypothetical protein AB0O07_26120 [Streptomyces sp. NPDC093085]|uniref:hypothetical protein n=1 Tax=Streptomyces sp. NPDC093085 TaxID=3155068 RepID=UPI003431CFAA